MKAMTRKATPAQNRLPLRSQTTNAMMAAGRKKNRTFAIIMIMTMPMISRISSTISSNANPMPRDGRGIGGAIDDIPQKTFDALCF